MTSVCHHKCTCFCCYCRVTHFGAYTNFLESCMDIYSTKPKKKNTWLPHWLHQLSITNNPKTVQPHPCAIDWLWEDWGQINLHLESYKNLCNELKGWSHICLCIKNDWLGMRLPRDHFCQLHHETKTCCQNDLLWYLTQQELKLAPLTWKLTTFKLWAFKVSEYCLRVLYDLCCWCE